jgi:hypothetical protein
MLLVEANTNAQQLVRVGYSGTGVAKNLHKTIERTGLWKKRGLDIRLIYFTSGATMAQAMVGGDLEIADSDVPAMLNAVSSGVLDGKQQEGVKGPEYSYPRIAAALRERPVPEIKGVQAVMDSVKSVKPRDSGQRLRYGGRIGEQMAGRYNGLDSVKFSGREVLNA